MVPLSVLRDVNFLLFYSSLQYLIVMLGELLVPGTHATVASMFLRVQLVWLAVLYLLVFCTGVAAGFDSGFVLGDVPVDVQVREPAPVRAPEPAQRSVLDEATVALLFLNAGVLAGHWLVCFFGVLVCTSSSGEVACAELWGGEYAIVCVVVAGVMQTQLLLSGTLSAVRLSETQAVLPSVYFSVMLYALSVFAIATLEATYRGFVPTPSDCDGDDARSASFCKLLGEQHWIQRAQANMLIYGVAIPVVLDLVLNALYAALGIANRGKWRLTLIMFAVGFTCTSLWHVGGWHFALLGVPHVVIIACLIVWMARSSADNTGAAARKKDA